MPSKHVHKYVIVNHSLPSSYHLQSTCRCYHTHLNTEFIHHLPSLIKNSGQMDQAASAKLSANVYRSYCYRAAILDLSERQSYIKMGMDCWKHLQYVTVLLSSSIAPFNPQISYFYCSTRDASGATSTHMTTLTEHRAHQRATGQVLVGCFLPMSHRLQTHKDEKKSAEA